jgi:transposase-like protein
MVPKDESKLIQTFKCKSCGNDVVYKRKTVFGFALRGSKNDAKEKVVYLSCDEGHVHPYTISGA